MMQMDCLLAYLVTFSQQDVSVYRTLRGWLWIMSFEVSEEIGCGIYSVTKVVAVASNMLRGRKCM